MIESIQTSNETTRLAWTAKFNAWFADQYQRLVGRKVSNDPLRVKNNRLELPLHDTEKQKWISFCIHQLLDDMDKRPGNYLEKINSMKPVIPSASMKQDFERPAIDNDVNASISTDMQRRTTASVDVIEHVEHERVEQPELPKPPGRR